MKKRVTCDAWVPSGMCQRIVPLPPKRQFPRRVFWNVQGAKGRETCAGRAASVVQEHLYLWDGTQALRTFPLWRWFHAVYVPGDLVPGWPVMGIVSTPRGPQLIGAQNWTEQDRYLYLWDQGMVVGAFKPDEWSYCQATPIQQSLSRSCYEPSF